VDVSDFSCHFACSEYEAVVGRPFFELANLEWPAIFTANEIIG
jgi:hypothetical protein